MNLSGLVAVSGKPGLFKVIGQSKAGFILQHLEDPTSRIVVNTNARLAALDETTVYGYNEDIPLRSILVKMQLSAPADSVPDTKSDSKIHRAYFTKLVPEHDLERVYASDIKKIISWYKMLELLPLFIEEDPKEKQASLKESEALKVEGAGSESEKSVPEKPVEHASGKQKPVDQHDAKIVSHKQHHDEDHVEKQVVGHKQKHDDDHAEHTSGKQKPVDQHVGKPVADKQALEKAKPAEKLKSAKDQNEPGFSTLNEKSKGDAKKKKDS